MGPGRRHPSARTPVPPDTGAAALEFALVAPLLFTLLFGIFGVGWGLWEYQAARATAREAARLAAIGIPDGTGFKQAVICLGERNGMHRGSLTEIGLGFHPDASPTGLATAAAASVGGYVVVTLGYVSAVRDLPLAALVLTDDQGRFSTVTVTRIEQVAPAGVTADTTITVAGETCS